MTDAFDQGLANDVDVGFAAKRSMFSALFEYGKASRARPVENFTTEALAAIARLSPGLFLGWLSAEGKIPAGSVLKRIDTQRSEPEGILDMVVLTESAGRGLLSVFELKVNAGETGNQLTRYRDFVAGSSSRTGPYVLGRRKLDDNCDFLSWHSLRRHIDVAARPDPLWQEFARYLEEIRVSDRNDEPMTTEEAASLAPAFRLLGKISRSINLALEELRMDPSTAFLANLFPSDEAGIRAMAANQFARFGRMMVYSRPLAPNPDFKVFMGAWPDKHDGDCTHVGVWLEAPPRQDDLKTRLLAASHVHGLPETWQRAYGADEWQFLSRSRRFVDIPSAEGGADPDVVRALREPIVELADSGMLRSMLDEWKVGQPL
jgi:hypothetical protein